MAEKNNDKVCSICLNDFTQPKKIDCSHYFCCQCLHDYVKKTTNTNQFQCPICRRDIHLPDGGVNGFPSFIKLTYHTDDDDDDDDISDCGIRQPDAISDDKYPRFCDPSIKKSMNFNMNKSRVVLKLEETSSVLRLEETSSDVTPDHGYVCPNHHDEQVRVYCKDCLVAVCFGCFGSHHNGHHFSELQNTDAQQKIREDIKTFKQDLEIQIEKLRVFSETLLVKSTEIEDSSDTVCNEVDAHVRKICDAVMLMGEDLKNKTCKYRDEETSKLEKRMEEIHILSDKFKSHVRNSQILLEGNSVVPVSNVIPDPRKEIDQIKSKKLEIPDLMLPWFLKENLNTDVLSKQLGCLEFIFYTCFNVDDLIENGECVSSTYYTHGLPWCVKVDDLVLKGTLGIYLKLKTEEGTLVKHCFARSSITLINKNKNMSVIKEDIDEEKWTSGEIGIGWPSFVELVELFDPINGFIDDNKNFEIKTTVEVIKTEK